jgi:hypothetical protein
VLPYRHLDPNTPSSVRHVLALANKYELDHLRNRIVAHLESDWPQSLWEWDQLEGQIHLMSMTWGEKHICDTMPRFLDDYLPEPASAIRLAREHDIPTILPAAFYHLSRLSIWSDRHAVRSSAGRKSILIDRQQTAEWDILTVTDYICLLKGRAKLSAATKELLRFTLHIEDGHWSEGRCSTGRRELHEEIREACLHTTDLLHTLKLYAARESFGNEICDTCSIYIRSDVKMFRDVIWMELPEFFHLV